MISWGKPVMVGDEYFDIRCLSTDEKPTKHINNGSILIEIDTGKRYIFDYESKEWNEYT